MAVRYGQDAVQAVAGLMRATTGRVDDLLRELPPGVEVVRPQPGGDPDRWLWQRCAPVSLGGWGDPLGYGLVDDPGLRERLLRTVPDDLDDLAEDERRTYVRRSVDLAMEGGTASGVVYPLAVCEVARGMRVRNVGGTSAGAIAAAATAAAELGRSTGREGAGGGGGSGHVRAGFSGLADVLAWLLQLDGEAQPGRDREQFRLAQLLRPVRSQRHVFAVLVAVLRRRYWALPLAYVRSVGPAVQLAVLGLLVGAALAMVVLLDTWWAPGLLLTALVVLAGLTSGALLGLAWWAQRRRARSEQATAPLQRLADEASSRPPPDSARTNALVGLGLALAALVLGGVGVTVLSVEQLLQTAAVALALVLLASLVLLVGLLRWAGSAGERSYGLVSGATAVGPAPVLSRVAGGPASSVDRPLVPWLSDSLAELAGMPGTVLRFGHLWLGPGFEPLPESPDGAATPAESVVRELATRPGRRLVNLEVVTTDLSRGRPFRFPLPVAAAEGGPVGGAEQLWFDPADLSAALAVEGCPGSDVLPTEVVEAMTAVTPSRTVPLADGSGEVTLHRLPHPWNLPVVLAVRISLALPVLFTAVRLYRLVEAVPARDDLGRTVHLDGVPVASQAHPCVAEPLWFSDGGVTSNFPVHLFDSPLPRWPSFGLDLGEHPAGQPVQDVWLPQDWNVVRLPANPLGGSVPGLLAAALRSALGWRGALGSALPGFRSRVAAVRQHPGEGGVSLFMPRATVAALALRGALAGARLRERFRDDAQWERHRWLRLRVTAAATEHLRIRLTDARPWYQPLLVAGEQGLHRQAETLPGDPTLPPEHAWFVPDAPFWPHVARTLDSLAVPPPDLDVVAGGPLPQPSFEQDPPT